MDPVFRPAPAHLRLFIALPVPATVAERAGALLPNDLPALRRVRPEHMHLTLAFLGATPAARLDEVIAAAREAAGEVEPFALRLVRIGAFRDRRGPRTIWLGIGAGGASVEDLAGRVRRALAARGLAFDPKPAEPHLTLARVRSEAPIDERRVVAVALERLHVATALAFPIEALEVSESTLSSGGPRHTLRARLPLRAEDRGGRARTEPTAT